MTYYQQLRAEVPGFIDLLTIPGVGPRMVLTLHRQLASNRSG